MPFAMFFSGGQAVHYSPDFAATGYAGASHGCVNIRDYDAIAGLVRRGAARRHGRRLLVLRRSARFILVACLSLDFEMQGPVVEWRGPAPFYFLALPVEDSEDLKLAAKGMEYWGQVPVVVRIGATDFTTALFPKDGRYLLPLKDAVRRAEGIDVEDVLTVSLSLGRP